MIVRNVIEENEYSETVSWELYLDDKCQMIWGNMDENPEDATLDRGLSYVYDIPKLMKMAYEMGKNGEELKFTSELITR